MKRFLAVGLFLLVPGIASATDTLVMGTYDTSDANYTYCTTSEARQAMAGDGTLAAVATSTTVTATGALFTGMGVGDTVYFKHAGTTYTRKIVTYTSATSIVVDSNLTFSAAQALLVDVTWRDFVCGTAATDGWIDVGGVDHILVQLDLTTLGSTSIDVTVEGRVPGGSNATLTTVNLTAVVKRVLVITEIGIDAIRIGTKVNTNGADVMSIRVTTVKD